MKACLNSDFTQWKSLLSTMSEVIFSLSLMSLTDNGLTTKLNCEELVTMG